MMTRYISVFFPQQTVDLWSMESLECQVEHNCNLYVPSTYSHVQYAISQLRIVRSGLHLVTYLNVGNFCDKRTEKTLHAICVQGFLRFSDSNKQSQSVSLIYELA